MSFLKLEARPGCQNDRKYHNSGGGASCLKEITTGMWSRFPDLGALNLMYIKLLVLFGFDFNFPLIFGINKLYQIKASFPTFQLSDDKQTNR